MAFEIDGDEPPAGARPVGRGYKLILPESTGRSGTGALIGAVGKPRIEIRFPVLDQAGWEWWAALTGESLSVALTSITLWNDWAPGGAAWEEWTGGGNIHRPTYGNLSGGLYYDVTILITDLVKA